MRRDETRGQQQLAKSKNRDRDRQRQEKLSQKQKMWANNRRLERREKRTLDASVDVQPTWSQIVDWDFKDLNKVIMDVDEPQDLLVCGTLNAYEKSFDKTSTKAPKPLVAAFPDEVFFKTTTSDDQHIRRVR